MPKRIDIKKILIIGSGPIVIGQGCEFDYSGVQACNALRAEGYEIVLVNSNPATIMTDKEIADHTYIEPITWKNVARIIAKERPDALLSTMGGQTALNCALDLESNGILAKYNVTLIGAKVDAINKAENRALFNVAMARIGLEVAKSGVAHNMNEALDIQKQFGYPVIVRPSFTLGGSGGGIARDAKQFAEICDRGFSLSANHQLLIEESLLGWKEYELEVVRDSNDTCIIVCTIENVDPMGVHTGDSITVAPAQTLTDREYQKLRNASIAVLREIGVETGGSNVQFAVNPVDGRVVVIEMNPRVSRSSALASKATGFPIAKVAALLAVGYTLDELRNDLTGGIIPAAFEPSLDYVVVKIPRFNFDKFPGSTARLNTQMQAIGEVMAIGVTFQEAMQKALASLEVDLDGFDPQVYSSAAGALEVIISELQSPGSLRILYVADAFRMGLSLNEIQEHTGIDPWFLDQIQSIVLAENKIEINNLSQILQWKRAGFTDARIGKLAKLPEAAVRAYRQQCNVVPTYKRIDSCAAEFPAAIPYMYASYSGRCESKPSKNKKVIVLGSGPNRIGQGIEFDYCCVQAVKALQKNNIEAIMINCNPETVSTDYGVSDRLYFEGLRLETVLDIIELEQPMGVILQLGGQTPLKLAKALEKYKVPILGTSPETIDLAEDRERFAKVIIKLGLLQPNHEIVEDADSALKAAAKIGYPVMVRPSYVLGGRAMQIIHADQVLQSYMARSQGPILIDKYLENAIEVDVDVIADGQGGICVAGIMEHVEPAGVHSGDSGCCIPPHTLSLQIQKDLTIQAKKLASELKIQGLMNVQFAIYKDQIYILEVNPRASRTVPFVTKAIDLPVAQIAVDCMLGKKINLQPKYPELFAVKQPVFPFNKFPSGDPLLGPEMRSTGEVMSFGDSFASAYAKSMHAVGIREDYKVARCFLEINADTMRHTIKLAQKLIGLGVDLLTDSKTGAYLELASIPCTIIGDKDRAINLMGSGVIDLLVSNSPDKKMRVSAMRHRVHVITEHKAAHALLDGMSINREMDVYKLQMLVEEEVLQEVM